MIRCTKIFFIGKEGSGMKRNTSARIIMTLTFFKCYRITLSFSSHSGTGIPSRRAFSDIRNSPNFSTLCNDIIAYVCGIGIVVATRGNLISLTLSFTFSYCRRFSLRCHVKTEEG